MGKLKIGVILGSGFEDIEFLENFQEKEVETPFGKPSSPMFFGKINGMEVRIIFRHGKKHEIPPTFINNKANIFALKYEGCKYILSTTDANSLKEEIRMGDLVIPDDFIDFTKNRSLTFYDKFEFGAMHTYMNNPFSELLRKKIFESCKELGIKPHKIGTAITTEGSRYSTKAESRMFQKFADISTMTIAPECILANEAEVHYATVAMIGDYDAWKESYDLSIEEIKKLRRESIEKIKKIILKIVDSFSREEEIKKLKEKVRVIYDFPEQGETLYDISPMLYDKDSLKKLTEILFERYKDKKIDVIVSTESKSFAVAGILAEKLNTGLVIIERGVRRDLIHSNQKVLLIEETFSEKSEQICKEIKELESEIVEVCSLIEYKKAEDISVPNFSLIKFEGE